MQWLVIPNWVPFVLDMRLPTDVFNNDVWSLSRAASLQLKSDSIYRMSIYGTCDECNILQMKEEKKNALVVIHCETKFLSQMIIWVYAHGVKKIFVMNLA